jgi:hypothetical protein
VETECVWGDGTISYVGKNVAVFSPLTAHDFLPSIKRFSTNRSRALEAVPAKTMSQVSLSGQQHRSGRKAQY